MRRNCRYMLRYTLVPRRNEGEKINELKKFCIENKIGEVMFFLNAEELNQGHLGIEETEIWLHTISKAKVELEKEGIIISLNPWHTLLHGDRGRKLKTNQHFRLMVDPEGTQSSCCVCPLDPEWRKYIAEIYKLYASLKPNIIWVDDDFRYHNHLPLKWGGCFCGLHLEEMSRRIGKEITREDLLHRILKPGEPHPYRKIWFDLLGESIVDVARILREAVDSVTPEVKLGLMSSDPIVHAVEGRKWDELLSALSGDHEPILRPDGGYYCEVPGREMHDFAITKHEIACVPQNTRVCPEIENFPYTRFTKSCKQTMTQILMCQLAGVSDVTLNLFGFMGNGVGSEPDYGAMLGETKPYFDAVANLFSEQKMERGVRIIFNPQSSYSVETEVGENIDELYTEDRGWAVHLSALGISYWFDPESKGNVSAISGSQVLGMKEEEITELLKKGLFLDATATYHLFQKGYGNLLGLKDVRWIKLSESGYAYEEIINDDFGPLNRRMSAQLASVSRRILKFELVKACSVISQIYTASSKVCSIGSYVYENQLGGRVATLAYPLTNTINIGFLGRYRQQAIQNLIKWLSNDIGFLFMVENQPLIYSSRIDFSNYFILALINFSTDPINEMDVYLENFQGDVRKCDLLAKDGRWRKFKVGLIEQQNNSTRLKISQTLNYMDSLILKFKK